MVRPEAVPSSRPTLELLLVEDNPGDIVLMRQAMAAARITDSLTVITNGADAIDYLRAAAEAPASKNRPDVVLLDLNLPQRNGREVLRFIKTNRTLRRLPVIIFTSSNDEQDVRRAYNLHANCYVTKPSDFSRLITTLTSIEHFWRHVVRLPNGALT